MTGTRTYTRSRSARNQTLTALGSGLFGLVVAVIMFVQQLKAPPQAASSIIPGAVAAIVTGSLISLLFGYGLARSPSRITLDGNGLLLEGLLSTSRLSWSQIAELRREKMQQQARKPAIDVLVLRDDKDKTLARIPGTFEDFATLVGEIETRSSAARGVATYDRQKEFARRLRGQKRDQRMLIGLGSAFILAGGFLVWSGGDEVLHDRELEAHGVAGQAQIVRRYMRNVTPRLEYSITDAGGATFKRDVAMDTLAWHALASVDRVTVVYLPSDANWSHLVAGEVPFGSPIQTLVTGSLGLVMGTVFLIFVAMGYCGIDSKGGKVRLLRLGQITDALEPTATPVRRA
jgi:hypothetical protein